MKNYRLAQEELIFSDENFIQNLKFLEEDLEKEILPRKYVHIVDDEEVTVIVLNRMTITRLMGSFKNLIHFRLIVNLQDRVILMSPAMSKAVLTDDIALDDYSRQIAEYVIGMQGSFGSFGSKTEKTVKKFQLWDFFNYKILLDE